MSEFVTSADGTRIAFDQQGEGPGVVLIGGAFQYRGFDPATVELASLLAAEGFTVINYDRRGRGESGPAGPGSLERQVQDVAALVDHLGGTAALYGSSSGSAIALWAAQLGVRTGALVLWEPPLDTADDGAQFATELQLLVDAGEQERAVEYFMKDMPPEWVEGAKASPAWPTMVQIIASNTGDAAVLARSKGGQPWAQRWSQVTAPTLVLTGESTLPLFSQAGAALVEALPDARAGTVPTSEEHRWEPAVLAAVLAEFLHEVLAPQASS